MGNLPTVLSLFMLAFIALAWMLLATPMARLWWP